MILRTVNLPHVSEMKSKLSEDAKFVSLSVRHGTFGGCKSCGKSICWDMWTTIEFPVGRFDLFIQILRNKR